MGKKNSNKIDDVKKEKIKMAKKDEDYDDSIIWGFVIGFLLFFVLLIVIIVFTK